ncbi:methyl-accepting chemotaxis protein [Anaeromicropila herbilytica]|uniref:Methyl-accepting chemotaxis protein n=1 Tax=Anaeromicropila herbilytica TaxID=2785025 RepID=A0A7R7EJW1_9FIRM|nr:methyl-accepting chemotaxis protein [Anaeromicropila herbilytica]BCN30035.1 methyl-accepting chemotaxis protein [Anaeromicropila herbilytica]
MKFKMKQQEGINKVPLKESKKINIKKMKFKGFKKAATTGIQMKLIGAFLIPVAFIICLGIISYEVASKNIINNYENATQKTIDMTGQYFDLGFQGIEASADEIASDLEITRYFNSYYKDDTTNEYRISNDLYSTLANKQKANKLISDIHLIANYGTSASTAGTVSNIYNDFIASEEGKKMLAKRTESVWTGEHKYIDKQIKIETSKYGISYLKQFPNTDATVIADVKYDEINRVLKGLDFGKSSIVGFVVEDGRELLTGTKATNLFHDKSYYKKISKSKTGSGNEYVTYKNKKYFFAFKKLDGIGASICVLIPKSVIIGKVSGIKYLSLVIVTLASIAALAIASVISSGIGNTIKDMNRGLYKVSSGNLTVDITTKRKDEFLTLANSIRNMVGSMKELILKMTTVSAKVSSAAYKFADSSTMLVKSSKEIATAIGEIEAGVSNQADYAQSCVVQMDELANKINLVYNNTQKIDKITTDTKEIIGNGMITMDELGHKAKNTAVIAHTMIENIETLEEESGAIENIIEVINGIAEETRLLALNASIEAARAGSAGKGFAVVADEIRKLANESGEATGKIRDIITNIQNRTKLTAGNAKDAENIIASQEEALHNTVEVFRNIQSSVDYLSSSLTEIASDAKNMEMAKDVTLESIEQISAVTEETKAVSEEVMNIAERQLQAVNELHDEANRLEDNAKELDESVHLFQL